MFGFPITDPQYVRRSLATSADTPAQPLPLLDLTQSDRAPSPILRCVAAIGTKPLSDTDITTIRVLVERMSTFAAYRSCIPGDLAAVEAQEDAQKEAWNELMAPYLHKQQRSQTRPPLTGTDPMGTCGPPQHANGHARAPGHFNLCRSAVHATKDPPDEGSHPEGVRNHSNCVLHIQQ